MTLSISGAVESLLRDALSPAARTALLRAGAPDLLAAREALCANPALISSWDTNDAALVISLVEDPDVLRVLQQLEHRPVLSSAFQSNPHAPREVSPASVLVPPFPPGAPTVAETKEWAQHHPARTPEFFQWLILSSPDPVSFLTQYAQGAFGICYPEFFLTLQDHEDVMTLEMFLSLMPASKRLRVFQFLAMSTSSFGTPLVLLFQKNNHDLPPTASYTPEARLLLEKSPRPYTQAIFLIALDASDSPDLSRFGALPADLQAMVVVRTPHQEHRQAYALELKYAPSAAHPYDPSYLLQDPDLDFAAKLNLMRWADADEILDYIEDEDCSPEQLALITSQVFSDVSQVTTVRGWGDDLNERDPQKQAIMFLVETTIQNAPGLVGLALHYSSMTGALTSVMRSRIHVYCGEDAARWESILSLGPTWAGTLPELLECAGLTGTS